METSSLGDRDRDRSIPDSKRIELTANSVKQLDDVTDDLSEPFEEVLLAQGDVFPSIASGGLAEQKKGIIGLSDFVRLTKVRLWPNPESFLRDRITAGELTMRR